MIDPGLEEKFSAVQFIINNLPKEGPITISNDEKLMFYGLYKQGTIGPCNVPKPSLFSIVERYKWDAWVKNGEMSKEDAIKKYIELLLKKIEEVERTYDIKQWLVGDLFELLAPKFAMIGKNYMSNKKKEIEDHNDEEEKRPVSPNEIATSTSTMVSDTEYCDALDDDQLTRSRTSSYELQDSPRPHESKKRHYMKEYCGRLEAELKNISQQIENLSLAVDQRHASLMNIFRKAIYTKKHFSWTTLFWFIVWPFVANVLMRYIGKFFLRLQ